jgi:hypothetical protein
VRSVHAKSASVEATPSRRNLKPKPATAMRAVTFTDDDPSCFPVTGLVGHRVREVVAKLAIPHVRIGRRMIIAVDAWESAIGRAARAPGEAPVDEVASDQPETADEVLAALGRRRSA